MPQIFSDTWKKARFEVLERDDYQCTNCGSSNGRMHVHHKDGSGDSYYNKNADNSLENLITLCNKCHPKLHKVKIFELGEIDKASPQICLYPYYKRHPYYIKTHCPRTPHYPCIVIPCNQGI